MILIADSGSTKCDWISVDSQGNQLLDKLDTKGLNPALLTEKELSEIIQANPNLIRVKDQVSHVFFYGAGCGTENPRLLLKEVLQNIFQKAFIEVKEDTLAAVRASLNHKNEAAVVCILGTGSNCSFFDGEQIHQRVASLGYSIMDDASGNYYGRQLIRGYYFNQMPEKLKVLFAEKFNLEADAIKNKLYKQANPNAYLATFAEFIFTHKDSDYIKNLIIEGLRLFSKNMILQYSEEIKTIPVHFVGSIAHFSKEEVLEVAEEFHFKVGNIIRRPIEGLVKYHINHLDSWK
ncbi:N-acetylglucosamine kinase [Xanthomarina sp. F1114]|uniref:N-acetylglucosamine kinase n=1 Tax=Xanthomarina sp. F1114 TaxID=2996019 RepID=UPI00225E4711|nr:N-acetylglucosamine kinase [Xanthomarina sp. F1114]MCX7548037.1 N-acetylglucosamine kinase [Xanthomarina sp. F1114]